MKDKDFKVGDTVYYWDKDILCVVEAKILDLEKEGYIPNINRDIFCLINDCYICERTGERRDVSVGTRYYYKVDLYYSADEAFKAYESKEDIYYHECLSEIKTLEDLINFPLNHLLNGECTNYTALKAYKTKAKELLGIEVWIK